MVPKYTDAELMLFAEAYNETGSHSHGSIRDTVLEQIKEFITQGHGILHDIFSMPFEDLPLHLSANTRFSDEPALWYEACVSIRLKIGR